MTHTHLRRWITIAIIFVAISCGNNEITLEGVDLDVWKQDPKGCRNMRSAMGAQLENQRDKLVRLSDMEIVDLLGKPDENELFVRSQQFYRYYIDPAPSCEAGKENPRVLIVRFNALGVCHEVSVE